MSVSSSSSAALSSPSKSGVVLRCIYKNDNTTFVSKQTDTISDKPTASISSPQVPISSSRYNIHSIRTNSSGSNESPISPTSNIELANWLNKKSNWNQVSVVSVPPRFKTECRKKSAILARHDFKKPFSISTNKTEHPPVISHYIPKIRSHSSEVFERHNVFHLKTNGSDMSSLPNNYEIENSTPSTANANKYANKDYNIFVKTEGSKQMIKSEYTGKQQNNTVVKKPNSLSTDTPLSPESMKKKELCTYLKLVNLNADDSYKKMEAPNQKRRSVRVKNHLIQTEKKELEKKLNGEGTEVKTKNVTQRTFHDVFREHCALMQTDDDYRFRMTVGCIPKQLLEKKEDFDDYAAEFLSREKTQNTPLKKRGRPKKCTTQKADETIKNVKIKEKYRKPYKNGTHNLRRKQNEKKKTRSSSRKYNIPTISLRNNEIKTNQESEKKASLETSEEEKMPERNEKNVADVVMQDHDYICRNIEDEEGNYCVQNPISPCRGFSSLDRNQTSYKEINKLCSELSDYLQNIENTEIIQSTQEVHLNLNLNVTPTKPAIEITNETPTIPKTDIIDPSLISPKHYEYIALDPEIKPKSLHRTLIFQKTRKRRFCNTDCDTMTDDSSSFDPDESPSTSKKGDTRNNLSHSIHISKQAGAVVKAFYANFNLIIVQEYEVTFWSQSALGNILGAHNMWLPKGQVSRLVLDNGCIQKDANEMVISLENSISYVELWTKEHKSDKREMPVADVFAALYFCKFRQNGVFKKVLQLENINSSAEDVRYIVMQKSRNVIVSWRILRGEEKMTVVHCYHLAADYQTVEVIKEIQSVRHYVASLHNIEGSDDLIIGYGENLVTLWNLEYGYIIATVEIIETMQMFPPLHVRCDRGFLFLLQQLENGNLCLIAINGLNQSWKRLKTFVPPSNYKSVTGVCLENGLLVAFYKNGILAWHMNSGELRVEEECLNNNLCIPSGKHAIIFSENRVNVRHALALLIASDDCDETVENS